MAKKRKADDDWIVTYTGRKVRPLDPEPSDIDIDDIAHALSNICRFTGHCHSFYSVAQHSVYVSHLVEQFSPHDDNRVAALIGLLHDATEAYLCDVARPLKRQEGFSAYRIAETRLWAVIAVRFGLPIDLRVDVKTADEKIVTNEAYALMPTLPEGWQLRTGYTEAELVEALGTDRIESWAPQYAKDKFMDRYLDLTSGAGF